MTRTEKTVEGFLMIRPILEFNLIRDVKTEEFVMMFMPILPDRDKIRRQQLGVGSDD